MHLKLETLNSRTRNVALTYGNHNLKNAPGGGRGEQRESSGGKSSWKRYILHRRNVASVPARSFLPSSTEAEVTSWSFKKKGDFPYIDHNQRTIVRGHEDQVTMMILHILLMKEVLGLMNCLTFV